MSKRKTIRRFKADGDMVYSTYADLIQDAQVMAPGKRVISLRFVVATAVALVLVFGGGVIVDWNGGNDAWTAVDFNVMVYAEPSGGEAIVQEISGSYVALPSGVLRRGSSHELGQTGRFVNDVFWDTSSFYVVGDGIASVSFSAERGGFANYDGISIHPVSQSEPKVYDCVRHYRIDQETYYALRPLVLGDHQEFQAFLNTGAIDSIIGREFRDTLCQSNPALTQFGAYSFSIGQSDANGYMAGSIAHDEALPQHYELQVTCTGAESDLHASAASALSASYWELDQPVAVVGEEQVRYCPPFEVLDRVAVTGGYVDYSLLGVDVIRITVTTLSGDTLEKAVYLSFNQRGALCASMTPPAVNASESPSLPANCEPYQQVLLEYSELEQSGFNPSYFDDHPNALMNSFFRGYASSGSNSYTFGLSEANQPMLVYSLYDINGDSLPELLVGGSVSPTSLLDGDPLVAIVDIYTIKGGQPQQLYTLSERYQISLLTGTSGMTVIGVSRGNMDSAIDIFYVINQSSDLVELDRLSTNGLDHSVHYVYSVDEVGNPIIQDTLYDTDGKHENECPGRPGYLRTRLIDGSEVSISEEEYSNLIRGYGATGYMPLLGYTEANLVELDWIPVSVR